MTSAQMRAARAILDLHQEDLSAAAGLSRNTIKAIEGDGRNPRQGSIRALQEFYESRGIVFIGDDTVRFRPAAAAAA